MNRYFFDASIRIEGALYAEYQESCRASLQQWLDGWITELKQKELQNSQGLSIFFEPGPITVYQKVNL